MRDLIKDRIFLVCIALVLLGNCTRGKGPANQASAKHISVKGFTLGMDFAEARGNALKLFEEGDFDKAPTIEFIRDKTEMCLWLMDLRPVTIDLYKDDTDRLTKIEMSTYAVNAFFKAWDVKAADFVKEFAKNYELPGMASARDELDIYNLWKYESKDGWFVQINDAKYLKFGKTPEKAKPVF